MKKLHILICGFFLSWSLYAHSFVTEELPIVIITASYNNSKWCELNLKSIFMQQYSNYRVIYINDCSTDDTYEKVMRLITEFHQEHRFTVINNPVRRKALANKYDAIHSCDPHAIIINLDGDDFFPNSNVLSYINNVYSSDPMVWMTYGQFMQIPGRTLGMCKPIPQEIMEANAFREYEWVVSHLRTYYAGLFQKIDKKDLMYNGDFVPMAEDAATLFPMLEMARNGHIRFIPDVLMYYNAANEINDCKVSAGLQLGLCNMIRKKTKYPALEQLFD